jgi:anthranilate/para-aminobenzoate synthase component I
MNPVLMGRARDGTLVLGGAITVQSTDKAEYLEMEVKATSALIAFLPDKVQGKP